MRKLQRILKLWRMLRQYARGAGKGNLSTWLGCAVDTYLAVMVVSHEDHIEHAYQHVKLGLDPLHHPLIRSLRDADKRPLKGDTRPTIPLNTSETANNNRQTHAEALISALRPTHPGRNEWLLNYGVGAEAQILREQFGIEWDGRTQSAELRESGVRHHASK